jgi:selenocysteine-specific elongation factor
VQVIATAGHVDHGKSALVRALTGMEPDRWAQERRRGLTIDLGFAWLTQPDGERLAFVDVPGHERFVPNMLAGVGPVPAVLFVVAADGGWMPQSAEHLAAIDALGISRGLLAVSRADLADPGPAMREASEQIGRTSLGQVPAVAVSALTGQGLPELRTALAELTAGLPAPDPGAPVRLWVDRAFSMTGSGTVVTGTLPAGTLRAGDELLLTPAMRPVRIRAIESLNEKTAQVTGVARVAVNLRGTAVAQLARGMTLVEPGCWTLTSMIDVRLAGPAERRDGGPDPRLPRQVTVHIGSARTQARVRRFGGPFVRLSLHEPLPLHVGDRLLLRDPGAPPINREQITRERARQAAAAPGRGRDAGLPPGSPARDARPAITGAIVLDVSPPAPPRRGAATAVSRELGGWPDPPGAGDLLRRHGLIEAVALRAMGLAVPAEDPRPGRPVPVGQAAADPRPGGSALVRAAGWLADPGHWSELRERLAQAVEEHAAGDPLAVGMPLEAARAAAGLPDRRLVEALAAEPGGLASGRRLTVADGYLRSAAGSAQGGAGHRSEKSLVNPALPGKIADAVAALRAQLSASPFRAPDAGRLRELGLDRKAIAAAERAGLLVRISPEIVLAPGADAEAARILAGLPQPFSAAQARQALDTTRRVAIPLLEYLDRAAVTRRLPDDRRMLRPH